MRFSLLRSASARHSLSQSRRRLKLEPGFHPLFNGKDSDRLEGEDRRRIAGRQTEAYKGHSRSADGVGSDRSEGGRPTSAFETQKKFDGDVHIKFDFKPEAKCNNDLCPARHEVTTS